MLFNYNLTIYFRSDIIWNGNVCGHPGALEVRKCRHQLNFRFWNLHLSLNIEDCCTWMSMNGKCAFYMFKFKINATFLSLKWLHQVHFHRTPGYKPFKCRNIFLFKSFRIYSLVVISYYTCVIQIHYYLIIIIIKWNL